MFSRRRQGPQCLCRYSRAPEHSGSWYSADATRLQETLLSFLAAAEAENPPNGAKVRGVIAPHAGFSYSGPTAAFAYAHMRAQGGAAKRRVFILGPSHHVYLDGAALSGAVVCETPLGELRVDREVLEELLASGEFEVMAQHVDEAEHSLEMHMPFVRLCVGDEEDVSVVPIMIGATEPQVEEKIGRILAPYLQDEANFFVVSSDFCHWGSRFRYQPFDASSGLARHEFIEAMDRRGMELIERLDLGGYYDYLRETSNTICGRHPIGVLLQMLRVAEEQHSIEFVKYAQSSPVIKPHDSSVSYASALLTKVES